MQPDDRLPLEAREHLLSVRPNAIRDMFQTFPEAPGATGNAQVLHAPRGRGSTVLSILNARGQGVYFALSDFTGDRRWISYVSRVFHLWVDQDEGTLPAYWPFQPHAIVNTSPNRHQIIWRVDGLPQDNTVHRQMLIALAHRFGGDPKATGTNRVLRLAGFNHLKREPYRVRLLHVSDHPAWTLQDAQEAIPELHHAAQPQPSPAARPVRLSGAMSSYVAEAVRREHDNAASAPSGARNVVLHSAAIKLGTLVGAGALPETDARDALIIGALANRNPLPQDEINRTIASGLRYGLANPRQLDVGAR
jgi:hypothetical protein